MLITKGARLRRFRTPPYRSLGAVTFLVIMGGLSFFGKVAVAVFGLYLVTSAVAFAAYGLDKNAAKNGQWRTQERTLHLLALFGGWPGALAAQELFRHKCRKFSFQIVFWVAVVFNCTLLGWLLF